MLPALVFLALAVFASALFWSPTASRTAYLHLMLAAGAMPLIFGAMSNFIPVLTRTREASSGMAVIPAVTLAGGALAVAAFSFSDMAWGWRAGAMLAMASSLALLAWTQRRRKATLGQPHPGLGWYQAALACLGLALLAILSAWIWPEHFSTLRRVHLHLNTLGFIGLTAVGSLAVLMPTAAGRPDAQAAQRLRHDLPWAAAGTLVVAIGSAWLVPFAWVGTIFWAIALVRLAAAWLQLYRDEIFAAHGAAPLLAAALAGFTASLLSGAASAASIAWFPDARSVFLVGFLLPLVSGAASQLLPAWLRPGVQGAWHRDMRHNLGHHNGIRALLFLGGGTAAGLGYGWGMLLGAAALAWFLLQVALTLTRSAVTSAR
jgi:hypothetical protein